MKVVILQRVLMHYREEFYEALLLRMKGRNVDLTLYYGETKKNAPHASFVRLTNHGCSFEPQKIFGNLVWFPILRKALKADLVITEDSAKVLINYILFAAQFLGGPKLVFWGHGRNHQTDNPDSFQERLKQFMGRFAHRYFAYTWRVREELIQLGYDPGRVIDVQNAVEAPKQTLDPAECDSVRRELDLGEDSVVGLYCGNMYPRKRLDWLIAAANLVHEEIPQFKLILAGAGQSERIAKEAAQEHDYIYYVGPVFDEHKAAYFAVSRFVVFPGLLGLGIVDSFHHGVPPVVTEYPFHSPEIAYLIDGENGLLTENCVEGLARGMIRVSLDDELHVRLVAGCKEWSERLTIDAMADRFAEGIMDALRDVGQLKSDNPN